MNRTVLAQLRPPVLAGPPEEGPPEELWVRRRGLWLARLSRNISLSVGGVLVGFFLFVGLAAVIDFGPRLGNLPSNFLLGNADFVPGPSWAHPFGFMGGNGVDILPAVFQATPWDLALVGGPIVGALFLGLGLGGVAATGSTRVDVGLTFLTDLLVGVPPWILIIVFFLAVQPLVPPEDSLLLFGIVAILVLWPFYARPIRARAKVVAVEPFVEAARAVGATRSRLLVRHILPNSLYPAFAQVPVDIFNMFFVLTAFPYIGCAAGAAFGYVTPLPTTVFPEWGYLLATGACRGFSVLPQLNFWWMYLFPLGTIVLFTSAVTFLCDGLLRWFEGAPVT